jgi:ABC-type Na+ efflux pump permease subunit
VERLPSPNDLRGAAAVAQTLAYLAGIAGVVAGALLYRDGETGFAVVAWVLTFAAGAILMIASFLARGMAALLGRIARIEQDVATFVARRQGERERDPWARHNPPY